MISEKIYRVLFRSCLVLVLVTCLQGKSITREGFLQKGIGYVVESY
jgi:hypothetical protein